MKTNIAISALFTAAAFLTPAHATSILFSATTTLPSAGNYSSPLKLNLNDGAGYILAYGYDNMFSKSPTSGTAVAPQNGATPVGLTVQPDLSPGPPDGLGDHNTNVGQDNGFIAPTDAVVLDFANVSKTANNGSGTGSENQITFKMYQDYAGADYEVYGLTGGTVNTSSATWSVISSGVIVAGQPLSVQTSTQYTYYALGVTDCAIDIESVQVQYSGTTTQQTPEPGTFVMAGMALIGLGMTMKKRSRKA